jgi:FdhE protein
MTALADADLAGRGPADPEWQPWLAILAVAHEVMNDPQWARAVSAIEPPDDRLADGAPLLEDGVLVVDTHGTDRFVRRLLEVAGHNGAFSDSLRRAAHDDRLDARALLEAAITEDEQALDHWAAMLDVDSAAVGAVAGVATTPLLHACRRAWSDRVSPVWKPGYCPICGGWPALAEARGLERSRHLRCGRCGGGWRTGWLRCAYCDNADHATLGSLVTDAPTETRKVETCDACRGYLKSITTLRATPPETLALVDLHTVELDVVALEHGYTRPGRPGYRLRVRVIEASS